MLSDDARVGKRILDHLVSEVSIHDMCFVPSKFKVILQDLQELVCTHYLWLSMRGVQKVWLPQKLDYEWQVHGKPDKNAN